MSDFQPPNPDDLDESIPPPPNRRRGNLLGWFQDAAGALERHREPEAEGGPPRGWDEVVAAAMAVGIAILIPGCLIALGVMIGWIFAGGVAVVAAVWALYMLFTNRDGPGGLPDWYHHW
jgi:hypothetical protein